MILPDRMFSSEWIRDLRLRRLPAHVQLLLIFLRPLCDRNGRFEFNPALIHMALYASAECSNVSVRDVEAWLETLRSGGFIKSYTGAAGRRIGEVAKEYWRQKLNYGKDVYDPEHEQPELLLPAADRPPDKKISKRGGRQSPPPFTSLRINSEAPKLDPAAETDDEWLARLVREWPKVDVPAQLAKAHRKRKGDVERVWFESVWLPGVSPMAALPSSKAPIVPVVVDVEPEAWRQHLKDHHEGEAWACSAESYTWRELPTEWRAKIVREMKQRRAA